MRSWVSAVIVLGVVLGFYFKIFSVDPISAVLLVVLLFTQHVSMERQQKLADVISKSHEIITANQKHILKEVQAVRLEVKNKK